MRQLLDEGCAIAPLVQRCRTALHEAPGARPDPILGETLERLAQAWPAADAADPGGAAAGDGPAPGAEPLTRKEIRVLQLLAEGYSNSVMAEKLFVSDSTVRTHLRNINLKLGARSRLHDAGVHRQQHLAIAHEILP